MEKVYIAIGLHEGYSPEILGVFKDKREAEAVAYAMETLTKCSFTNIIEKPIIKGGKFQ